ncbi:MAG: PqqD family protein [Acidobacteriota bacterium]|nr:MAG: PqqD family protein [Acidobacteriota bacterium]
MDFSSKVVQSPETLINIIEGESVLLNLKNESYYGLDEVGTRMWELLTTSNTLQEVYDALLDEYDVTPQTLKEDMLDLISTLIEHGLLEVDDQQAT